MKTLRLFILVILTWGSFPSWSAEKAIVVRYSGALDFAAEEYLSRMITQAEGHKAGFVVLALDCPIGFLDASRHLVETIAASHIAVVTYAPPQSHIGLACLPIFLSSDISFGSLTSLWGRYFPDPGLLDVTITADNAVYESWNSFSQSLSQLTGRKLLAAFSQIGLERPKSSKEIFELGVIDSVVESEGELARVVLDFGLRTSRSGLTHLPADATWETATPPNLIERVHRLLCEPSTGYLIYCVGFALILMALFGRSWRLFLYLGIIACTGGVTWLFLLPPIGIMPLVLLVVSSLVMMLEFRFPSFGLLGIGGLISFAIVSGYLVLDPVSEIKIPRGLTLSFGALFLSIILLNSLIRAVRKPTRTEA